MSGDHHEDIGAAAGTETKTLEAQIRSLVRLEHSLRGDCSALEREVGLLARLLDLAQELLLPRAPQEIVRLAAHYCVDAMGFERAAVLEAPGRDDRYLLTAVLGSDGRVEDRGPRALAIGSKLTALIETDALQHTLALSTLEPGLGEELSMDQCHLLRLGSGRPEDEAWILAGVSPGRERFFAEVTENGPEARALDRLSSLVVGAREQTRRAFELSMSNTALCDGGEDR